MSPAYSVIDPATEDLLYERPLASETKVAGAVAVARDGFRAWSRTALAERCAALRDAAAALRREADAIALLLTSEQGKPLAEARSEVAKSADLLDHFANPELVAGWRPASRRNGAGTSRSRVDLEPRGVAAAILPSNYPVTLLTYKVAPALAAGCSVVVKPDLQTSATVDAAVKAIRGCAIPDTVLQVVHCDNAVTERALVASPEVDVVSFTGSRAAGGRVARAAVEASPTRRYVLELGGSNALVVTADADVEDSVAAAVYKGFRNAGQVCHGVSAVLVERPLYEQWLEKFVAALDDVVVGDGRDPRTTMGPLATAAARDRVRAQVESARAAGATTHVPRVSHPTRGWFLPPTVVIGGDAVLPHDELFGPAVTVRPYDRIEAVVTQLNGLDSGLVTYLYGADTERLCAVAARLEVGTVGVNTTSIITPETPFGGWKASGIGTELGVEGLRTYQRSRHVRVG